jgi:hypothetical protein
MATGRQISLDCVAPFSDNLFPVQYNGTNRDIIRFERLAAESRRSERVCLVSSDAAVRGTSGHEVQKRSSSGFLRELEPARHDEQTPSRLGDRVDDETRAALERLRRGQQA